MDALEFWRTPGPMTDVGVHADWVAELPNEPTALRDVVAATIVHPGWAALYEVEIGDAGEAEKQLRYADRMLTAVRARVDQPATAARAPGDRIVGTCRNFSVLHTALLRAKGIPARARCGHAGYFEADRWVDHWVTEWWDPARDRWVRTDAQLDDSQQPFLAVDVDRDDLGPDEFLAGGECWQRVRSGEIDGDTCGIFDMWGAWFVRSNAVRDLASLNKVELLPWDDWGIMADDIERPDETFDIAIDALAAVTVPADDLAELQRLFADERYVVPATITSYVEGIPTQVTIER
jgi:hypothetical protein